MALCVLAISLLLALAPASPAPAASAAPAGTSTLSARTIFDKARLAMYLRTYPRYLAYIIDIQSTAYGKHYHEGYRAMLRTYDGALVVKNAPLYSSNQPPNPYGFSFFGLDPVGKPSDHIPPPFGVPWMSATYDFDLSRGPQPRHYGSEPPAPGATEPPPVLGQINVTSSDYDVTLLGREIDDGADVYHLALRPLDNPERNRVRELWVDASSFEVRKLVTQGIFEKGPPTTVPWTVTFMELHGHWLIRQEVTTATLAGPAQLFGGPVYHGIDYTFGAYAYPGLISDLEFSTIDYDQPTNAIQE